MSRSTFRCKIIQKMTAYQAAKSLAPTDVGNNDLGEGDMRSKTFAPRAAGILLASFLLSACGVVDQYGSRAFDGNLNTQNAINQEVLVNIIRASQYRALSWNPASQITGQQNESVNTGLPTISIGPAQTAANHIYQITNSVQSGVTGGFSTSPLATTAFQAGMLTPVDLKTIASLTTYYPREAIYYALIAAIDVKFISLNLQDSKLANDPNQAYFDINEPQNLNQDRCAELFKNRTSEVLSANARCSYAKFRNLLSVLIQSGLSTELVQIPGTAQANQPGIVTVGRFCFDKKLAASDMVIQTSNFPRCGQDKRQPAGGTIVVSRVENQKSDDVVVNTKTKSATQTTTVTTNSILPVTGRNFRVNFRGIGSVEITFELRSPNGFLSYLGAWYNVGDRLDFGGYDTIAADQILKGGHYLSIVNGPSAACYSWVNYSGGPYCVPAEATHTSMLMDIAVILRNLNISPTDLNAPVSVRVAN
jgi:hypothetical protein